MIRGEYGFFFLLLFFRLHCPISFQEGFSSYADRLVTRLKKDVIVQESQSEQQVVTPGAISLSVVPLAAAGILGAAVLAAFAMKNVFS